MPPSPPSFDAFLGCAFGGGESESESESESRPCAVAVDVEEVRRFACGDGELNCGFTRLPPRRPILGGGVGLELDGLSSDDVEEALRVLCEDIRDVSVDNGLLFERPRTGPVSGG